MMMDGAGRPAPLSFLFCIGVALLHRPLNELDRRRAGRRRIFFESSDLHCRWKLPSLCTHCGWMACRQADLLFPQSSYQFTRGNEEGEDFSQENERELLLEERGTRAEMAETEPAVKDRRRRCTLFKATSIKHASTLHKLTCI